MAPAAGAQPLPDVVAVMDRALPGPVRFAGGADALIVLDGNNAFWLDRDHFEAEPVDSIYGYPMATVTAGTGRALAPGAAPLVRRWWQVCLAAEVAGTGSGVVKFVSKYLKEREQFGKPLGAFQALQHRLIECYVAVEGVRWLTREAAFSGAPAELAASAAVAGVEATQRILQEAHQLSGAIGFTLEFDLHLWSLRLQTLRFEAGGIGAHARCLVDSRWR